MDYSSLLPDEHLLPLIRQLLPQELAGMTILMRDLIFAMTNNTDAANTVFNCVGSQIAGRLSDDDVDEFRRLLAQNSESPDAAA